MDLSLDRIKKLLIEFGNPQDQLKVIHITGTNGKGSVSAYTSYALWRWGYSVGRFNSPHLIHPSDCIQLNNEPMERRRFEEYIERVKEKDQTYQTYCTEFEKLTVVAFLVFLESKCDFVVLEVGMGGRLDATNVCEKPLICVFTPISLDHQNMLGNTVEKIAIEKSGILRKEVDVVIGKQPFSNLVIPILRKRCEELNCRWVVVSDQEIESVFELLPDELKIQERHSFQNENRATCFAILNILKNRYVGNKIIFDDTRLISDFVKNMKWKGRMEWISDPKLQSSSISRVLLDGAHNVHAIQSLSQYVENNIRSSTAEHELIRIHWIMGFSEGKDYRTMLPLLIQPNDVVSFCEFSQPQGMPWISSCSPSQLALALKAYFTSIGKGNEMSIKCFPDIASAIMNVKSVHHDLNKSIPPIHQEIFPISYCCIENENPKNGNAPNHKVPFTIVICGSLYLLSDFYKLIE